MLDAPDQASRAAAEAGNAPPDFFQPYAEVSVNFVYNVLFCDSTALFHGEDDAAAGEPWATLLREPPDPRALRLLIADEANESRLRALACHRLQRSEAPMAQKRLFGVVVEVPLSQGLDVLAAFADGQVRYINHTGKTSFLDGGSGEVNIRARRLVAAAQPLVEQLGSACARLPPPCGDRIRISFVASDGLYVEEGRYDALQKDARCGSVLAAALSLLQTFNHLSQR